jgi:prepilin-type processing-associated H-X9-DG protein
LIEILVVLVIIGILVAMVIPAVLTAREKARIVQCADHQKELGRAAVQFEVNHGRFPGYAESVPGYKDSSGVAYEAGWPVMLLKLLNREDVWNEFRGGNLGATSVKIAMFLCPSDGEAAGTGPALSYAANCGQPDAPDDPVTVDDQNGVTHTEYLPNPAGVPPDWAANGIFFRRHTKSGQALMVETVAAEDIKDGEQHTFLFSECYGAAVSEGRGLPDWPTDVVTERQFGLLWSQQPIFENGKPGAVDVNAPVGINCDSAPGIDSMNGPPLWIPTGYHPGGVNVTYCDGRVVFLSEDVTYKVYALQMTPNGADVWGPGEAKGKYGNPQEPGEPPAWCREPLPKP